MLGSHARWVAGIASLLVAFSPAHAQFPGLTASFLEPSATVAPTDAIDVWVRLALAPGAAPLQFDGLSPATDFGLPQSALPTGGSAPGIGFNIPFASYTSARTNVSYVCTGTFTAVCSPATYAYAFNPSNSGPATPTFAFRSAFTLLPGQTFDFLALTFTPVGGAAAPGTYTLYDIWATVEVTGLDAQGNVIRGSRPLASTCSTGNAACAFTRTVAATTVPEPGTVALLSTGLLTLAGLARRRRAA